MAFLFGRKKTASVAPPEPDVKALGPEFLLASVLMLADETEQALLLGILGNPHERTDQCHLIADDIGERVTKEEVTRLSDLAVQAPSAFMPLLALIRQNKIRPMDFSHWPTADLEATCTALSLSDRPAALLDAIRRNHRPSKFSIFVHRTADSPATPATATAAATTTAAAAVHVTAVAGHAPHVVDAAADAGDRNRLPSFSFARPMPEDAEGTDESRTPGRDDAATAAANEEEAEEEGEGGVEARHAQRSAPSFAKGILASLKVSSAPQTPLGDYESEGEEGATSAHPPAIQHVVEGYVHPSPAPALQSPLLNGLGQRQPRGSHSQGIPSLSLSLSPSPGPASNAPNHGGPMTGGGGGGGSLIHRLEGRPLDTGEPTALREPRLSRQTSLMETPPSPSADKAPAEGPVISGSDVVAAAAAARFGGLKRQDTLRRLTETVATAYVARGARASASGVGAEVPVVALPPPDSSSDVLVKQLKQDIALISRLPAELQMRSTRAQMLELVQWTRQATRSGSDQALASFWRWVNEKQVPVAIILCIPPERMPEGEIREDTFTDLLMPYRGLPTDLISYCSTVDELNLLRTWRTTNPRGLEAFELSLAMSSDAEQRFTATLSLPRPFIYSVSQRFHLDWCLEWHFINKDVMGAAASLIGQFVFEDIYACPPLILHHAPSVDAVKLICNLFQRKAGATVRVIAGILANELRGSPAPIKLFLADLIKIPLDLLVQAETPDQLLSLGRLADALATAYIPMDKLSPENQWRKITAGEFGAVYEAFYCGVPVALKVPFKIDDWLELTAAEITALLHVPPHPCVMQLYGITVKLVRGELELVLVTEYIHKGNGNQFLDGAKEKSRWSLDDRVLICYTIGQGLEHLHTLNPPIIHRDLKPDNILLRERHHKRTGDRKGDGVMVGVLTDFGLARLRHGRAVGTMVAGTDRFMAPEAFSSSQQRGIDEMSDVFSYGTLIWSLLTGKDPFEARLKGMEDAKATFMTVYKILVEEGKRPDDFEAWPRAVPLEVIKIVRSCWALEPRDRPAFTWINQQWKAFLSKRNLGV